MDELEKIEMGYLIESLSFASYSTLLEHIRRKEKIIPNWEKELVVRSLPLMYTEMDAWDVLYEKLRDAVKARINFERRIYNNQRQALKIKLGY